MQIIWALQYKCSLYRYWERHAPPYCLQGRGIQYHLPQGQYLKVDCAVKSNFYCCGTMGCIKSKSPFPHTILDDGSREIDGYNSGCNTEKSALIQRSGMSASTNTAVLDFAHRLSLEILDQAVKQWALTESKYSDIPFIESEEPWNARFGSLHHDSIRPLMFWC